MSRVTLHTPANWPAVQTNQSIDRRGGGWRLPAGAVWRWRAGDGAGDGAPGCGQAHPAAGPVRLAVAFRIPPEPERRERRATCRSTGCMWSSCRSSPTKAPPPPTTTSPPTPWRTASSPSPRCRCRRPCPSPWRWRLKAPAALRRLSASVLPPRRQINITAALLRWCCTAAACWIMGLAYAGRCTGEPHEIGLQGEGHFRPLTCAAKL
jgi:hypothetical protein